MTWWAVGSAVVGVAGSYLASRNASKASSSASAAEERAAANASATELKMYNQTRADNMPALGARNLALSELERRLGIKGDSHSQGYGDLGGPIDAGDVVNDAGYQFGKQQGMQGITNSFAARGMRNSGAAIKAAGRFNNDYATTKYDDAFNRELQNRNQQLNPLFSMGNLGQIGTSQIGTAGQNYGNQSGANSLYAGEAQAQNALAQGSIWGNAINQGAGAAGWYMNQNRPPPTTYGNGAYYQGNNGGTYANWDLSGTNRSIGD